jgi:DNA-binding NtrC family response regulator
MPPIRLTDDAKEVLMNYYWNGNVRQLKNITEQISVIEQQREINASVLKMYLPNENMEKLPALVSNSISDSKSFANEREILYQVLFDMKKDISDLKKIVNDLTKGNLTQSEVKLNPTIISDSKIINGDQFISQNSGISKDSPNKFENVDDVEPIQEAEYLKENEEISLADMERELIKKTLEKHKGKRKAAAKELKISERTLYRKIKDYNIDI